MGQNYIIANGERLILSSKAIAITKQLSDIADTEGRQTSYTNMISLPIAEQNIQALNLVTTVNSNDDAIYEKFRATLYLDGIPVEPLGSLRIQEVTGSEIRVVINGPEFDFFDEIDGRHLNELSRISNLDHNWGKTDIIATQAYTPTEGYIYPVIDYGGVPPSLSNTIDARYSYPAVFLMWLINEIFFDAGYTYTGDIFSDEPLLDKAVFPFSEGGFVHSDRYIRERSFEYFTNSIQDFSQAFTGAQAATIIGRVSFSGTLFHTVPIGTTFQTITAKINISRIQRDASANTNVYIGLVSGTGTILAQQSAVLGLNTISITSYSATASEALSVVIIAEELSAVSSPPAIVTVEVDSGSFFTPPIETDIAYGDDVTGESFVPDWTQKELLVFFMNYFGLIPKVNPFEKEVEFFKFEEVKLNKGKAYDWSSKLSKPSDSNFGIWYVSKKSDLGRAYSQINYLQYAEDDTLQNRNFGRGRIDSNNQTVKKEGNLFTLKVAASESNYLFVTFPTLVVRIHRWVGDYDAGTLEEETDAKQRFIFVESENTFLTLTDNTGGSSMGMTQAIGKFVDPNFSPSLAFSSGIQSRYYSALEEVLQDPQMIVAEFNLGARDISEFDFKIPVYVDKFSAFYYVNKILNYVPNEVTRVELVRI